MISLLSGLFCLMIYLTLTIVCGIAALIPLVAAEAIYSGKWATITAHDLLMLDESAFAGALGEVLSDHPLWQAFGGILGGFANQLQTGLNMQLFFDDAAALSLSLYGVLELIASAGFMLLWLRIQMDILSCIFRWTPLSISKLGSGVFGCIIERVLSGVYFSISLMGAFFSAILFNAVKASAYPMVFVVMVLAAEVVLYFGSRAISMPHSVFQASLLEEIISDLLKTGTLFLSMHISFFYFSAGIPQGDWRIALMVLSWAASMYGVTGESIVYQIAGFVVLALCGYWMGV